VPEAFFERTRSGGMLGTGTGRSSAPGPHARQAVEGATGRLAGSNSTGHESSDSPYRLVPWLSWSSPAADDPLSGSRRRRLFGAVEPSGRGIYVRLYITQASTANACTINNPTYSVSYGKRLIP
jgi:hypothetical protein